MQPYLAIVTSLVLLASLVGCTSGKPPVTISMSGLTIKVPPDFQAKGFRPANRILMSDANGEIVLKDYDFRCEHGPVDHDKGTDCKDIPVVIVWDVETQICRSLVPFNRLLVRTKGMKKTKIVWTIVGPKNAKFDNVGIELLPFDEGNTTPSGDVYEDAGPEGSDGKKFTISIKEGQREKKFGFNANVSIGLNKCVAIDPLIVNAEN